VPADAVGEDGLVQLWTDQHSTDAMFLALIRVGDREATP
jgi:hypothetical protein